MAVGVEIPIRGEVLAVPRRCIGFCYDADGAVAEGAGNRPAGDCGGWDVLLPGYGEGGADQATEPTGLLAVQDVRERS